MRNKKGIFSLETALWDESMNECSSIEPIFSSLNTWYWEGQEHRHFNVWTKEVFELHLNEWKKAQKYFPILLLSFHQEEWDLMTRWMLPMDELVEHLSNDAPNKAIIHISSHIPVEDEMEDFLKKTGALSVSVSGYKSDKWYNSVAFQLLFLAEIFRFNVPSTSIKMRNFVDKYYAKNRGLETLGESLGFRLWYRVDGDDSKTGKHPGYITPVPC